MVGLLLLDFQAVCGCQVVRSVDGSEWGEIVLEIVFCYVYRKELRLRYAMWKFANFHLNAFGFCNNRLNTEIEGKVLHYIYAY